MSIAYCSNPDGEICGNDNTTEFSNEKYEFYPELYFSVDGNQYNEGENEEFLKRICKFFNFDTLNKQIIGCHKGLKFNDVISKAHDFGYQMIFDDTFFKEKEELYDGRALIEPCHFDKTLGEFANIIK